MINLAAYAVHFACQTAVALFPSLCCVESALLLSLVLKKLGYSARVVEGQFRLDKELPNDSDDPLEGLTLTYGHVWVEIENTVIDITGDQFNSALQAPWPPIYIGPRRDRYLNPVETDPSELLDTAVCQAILFELRAFLPDVPLATLPTPGLGIRDFIWWSNRDQPKEQAFQTRLDAFGKAVEAHLTALTFRSTGRILSDETFAWMTWAPPEFGDNLAYRQRPHITLDVTPHELVLHLNLELAKNADHFAALVLQDASFVLDQARRLGDCLELQIFQRRELQPRKWVHELLHPYPLSELTPAKLLQAVQLAQAWGIQEQTRQAYYLSQHISAARTIALGDELPVELARRIELLRPGLYTFDWKH